MKFLWGKGKKKRKEKKNTKYKKKKKKKKKLLGFPVLNNLPHVSSQGRMLHCTVRIQFIFNLIQFNSKQIKENKIK
jgi:hypothetical protein